MQYMQTFVFSQAARLYHTLKRDEGILWLIVALRAGALAGLIFYFAVPQELPVTRAVWGLLALFALYTVMTLQLAWSRPNWLLTDLPLRGQIVADVLFVTLFYVISGNPRSDIYLLYLLPLFTAAYYLPLAHTLFALALVGLCFCTTLLWWGTVALPPEPLSLISYLRVLLARTFVLVAPTIFQAFRRNFSLTEDLRHQNSPVTKAFNSTSVGICLVDAQQQLTFVNDALRRRHGELESARGCQRYFQCNGGPACIWCLASSELSQRQQRTLSTVEGAPYDAQIISIPLIDSANVRTGAIGLVIDISEQTAKQHLLESELAESTGQVRGLTAERARWFDTLTDLGKRLAGIADDQAIFQFVVDEAKDLLQAEAATLFLLNEQETKLVRRATAGVDHEWLPDEAYSIGEGIVGSTLQLSADEKYGRPIRTDMADRESAVALRTLRQYQAKLSSHQVKHLICAPLNGQRRSFGVLRVLNKLTPAGQLAERGFTQEDEDFLVTIAAMVAIAVENARLLGETTRSLRDIQALHQTSLAVVSSHQLLDVLHTIVRVVGAVAGSSYTGVALVDEQGLLYDSVEDQDVGLPLHERARDEGVTYRIAETRAPYFCDDTEHDPTAHNPVIVKMGFRAYAGLPIITHERLHGVLFVHSEQPFAFSKKRALLQIFANHVATALENARLYSQVDENARLHARERLRDDLHDTMNFLQGAFVMRTATQQEFLAEAEYAAASDNAQWLRKAALHVYRTLQQMLQEVRDPILEEEGLIPALRHYASLLALTRIEFTGVTTERLPPAIEHALFKIAQEALHNALKHNADHGQPAITVALHQAGEEFMLQIEDNGIGFDATAMLERNDSFGLHEMQHWVQTIDATLLIDSQPGNGARLKIHGRRKAMEPAAINEADWITVAFAVS